MFFDDEWNKRSHTISFGHDIDAAWLVQEAAENIADENRVNKVRQCSLKIADAAAEGLDKDGSLLYESEDGELVQEKYWWPQAEAMVGFLHAWQLSGKERYLTYSRQSWVFIKQHILHATGEWVWGLQEDYALMPGQDKVGFWKCPYHNGRACLEVIQRVSSLGY